MKSRNLKPVIIIGVTGKIGSGKDVLVGYLRQKCDAHTVSVGDIVREIAEKRGIEKTRQNLHAITKEYFNREGSEFFMRYVCNRISQHIQEDGREIIAISGIRTPQDVHVLRERFGENFKLVAVMVTKDRVRYERIQDRDDPRDPRTFEAFKTQDKEEEKLFRIHKTIALADLTLYNDNSLADFYAKIEMRLLHTIDIS